MNLDMFWVMLFCFISIGFAIPIRIALHFLKLYHDRQTKLEELLEKRRIQRHNLRRHKHYEKNLREWKQKVSELGGT